MSGSGGRTTPEPGDPSRGSGRWLALSSAAISVLMAVVYTVVITGQGERPLRWVLAILLVSAGLAVIGSRPAASHRVAVLTAAGILLLGLGFLAILTIGLPIMVAGLLALLAALRDAGR